jgi:putative ATPase
MLHAPLAERLRPRTLEEFLGQNRLLGANAPLRKAIENDRLPSLLLWGPPGSGKTSLAHLIRQSTQHHFEALSAVTAGVKDVKDAIAAAKQRQGTLFGQRTLLFIDEIHRFNKGQQDALLPAVEDGTVTLIGATTENPSFELNNALLSRCQLLLLAPHSPEDLEELVDRALKTHPRGLNRPELEWDEGVLRALVMRCDGDARFLLNQLEWLIAQIPLSETLIRPEHLQQLDDRKPLRYDKDGDEHHNLISALHKSVRGSDVQASLYWLHRMMAAGEEARYLLRRMIRMAVEDIGLADPQALVQGTAALQAYELLGSPEGDLALSQFVVYLATAPKSNAVYMAHKAAARAVQEHGMLPVPRAYRNPVNSTGKKLGYGQGYLYDHDQADAYSGQEHLPQALTGTVFYTPCPRGYEVQIQERMSHWDQIKSKNHGESS